MSETHVADAGWSEALGANSEPVLASRRHARRSDEQLARAAGAGDVAAFEALYERHHRMLLAFARHMLGRPHDAEDVVQHTFAAADRAFRGGRVPKAVRAWLYTVARNRCVSTLRARRDDAVPFDDAVVTDDLVVDVEQREDLRRLLADLRRLPDEQRAALLLAELGELSHGEVAAVIGVRPGKVKALVFQARETLMALAHARAIPCQSIREELAVATGAGLRLRHLRHHLAQCPACADYGERVRKQRALLAAILPVVPSVALRDGVMGAIAAGGGAAGAASVGAGAGIGGLAAKVLAIAAVGGAAAGGGAVAVTALDERPPPRAQAAGTHAAPAGRTAGSATGSVAGDATPAARADAPAPRTRDDAAAERRREPPPVREAKPRAEAAPTPAAPAGERRPEAPPGQEQRPAVPPGQAKRSPDRGTPPGQEQRPATPPGQEKRAAAPPGQAQRPATPPGQAQRPATPPGQAQRPATPPGQAQRPATPPGQAQRPATPPGQAAAPPAPPPEAAAPPAAGAGGPKP